jgi:UDP-glucose 4-epimerase
MITNKKILVTGGCGYIGSHTIVDLIQHGYEVISIDDNSKSNPDVVSRIEKITGKEIKNYPVNLCDFEKTAAVFEENKDIIGVVHFAAYKAVGESVEKPILYFNNNLNSLLNILTCCEKFHIHHFVFSSSCTVYGNPDVIPVTEETPLKQAESPYGATKQMGETIIEETVKSNNINAILLRYFNPVGAHPSIEIGEQPIGKPANLFPAITQTAIGKLSTLCVFGQDYPTRDGSCIRDFIHVSDIAHAHTLALNYLLEKRNSKNCEVFNLGSGNGFSVLEVIHEFEKVTNIKLPVTLSARRAGDVIAIFANNNKAKKTLGWKLIYSLTDMVLTAWKWELKLKENK